MPQHVVIDLGHNSIFVLPVEESDVGGVYFVLVLNGRDKAVDGRGDEVERSVDVLGLLSHVQHDSLRGRGDDPGALGL